MGLKLNIYYKNILFFGHKKVGKTSIGKKIASKLKFSFLDTDDLIEERYFLKKKQKLSCNKIFLKEKNKFFRNLEQEVILSINTENSVISVGGGSLQNKKTLKFLKDKKFSIFFIFLNISFENFLKRNKNIFFPFNKEKLKKIYFTRQKIFERFLKSTLKIDVDEKSENQIVEEILCQIPLEKFLK